MVNSPPVQWYFEFCIFPDPPADIYFSQTLGSSSTHAVQDSSCLQGERKAGAVLTASSLDPELSTCTRQSSEAVARGPLGRVSCFPGGSALGGFSQLKATLQRRVPPGEMSSSVRVSAGHSQH